MKFLSQSAYKGFLRSLQVPLLRNATFITGNNIVNSLGGFIFWFLAAKFFSQTEVGLASSRFSVFSLLSGLAILGLGSGLIKFLSNSEDQRGFIFTASIIVLVSSVIVSVGYFISISGSSNLSQDLSHDFWGFFKFISFVILFSLSLLYVSAFIGLRRAGLGFTLFLLFNVLKAIALIAVLFISPNASGIIDSIFFSLVVSIVVVFLFLFPRVELGKSEKLLIDFPKIKRLMGFSFGTYIANYLFLAPSRISPILALENISEEASAYVYMIWMIAILVISPGVSLGQSALAESSFDPTRERRIILTSSKISLLVTLPLAIFVILLREPILAIFWDNFSRGAVELLVILMISAPISSFVSLFFAWLRIRNNIMMLVISSLVLAAFSISFPVFLMDEYDLKSIGYGWLVGSIIIAITGLIHIFGNKSSYTESENIVL
jgi:O-antigen/teichoic acid export membrane protein